MLNPKSGASLEDALSTSVQQGAVLKKRNQIKAVKKMVIDAVKNTLATVGGIITRNLIFKRRNLKEYFIKRYHLLCKKTKARKVRIMFSPHTIGLEILF